VELSPIKILFLFFLTWILCCLLAQISYSKQVEYNGTNQKYSQSLNFDAAQRIIITDAPAKRGKEIEDTTIVVKTELKLYASLYNNGKYRSEISVEWFWADTSHSKETPKDTAIFLGSGKSLSFQPIALDTGFIFVKSTPKAQGDSTGTITIIHGENLIISSIHCMHIEITQGQENIELSFRVENNGILASFIDEVGIETFAPDSHNLTDDYRIFRLDTTSCIPIGQTRDFKFLISANPDADTVLVTIDGRLNTHEGSYTNFESKHQWQVQSPPRLNIDWIDALIEEVYPGQGDLIVVLYISNHGMASVNNIQAELEFWYDSLAVTSDYEYKQNDNNPQLLHGHSSEKINLNVQVKPSAILGTIVINGKISALDANTGLSYFDERADVPASWVVTLTSASVRIVSTTVNCPNTNETGNGAVNLNQFFSIEVTVKNTGNEDVQNVGVTLTSDGFSIFKSDSSQIIPSILTNQFQTVTYDFVANAENLPYIETLRAKIDSATSAVSGGLASINTPLDSMAQVLIETPANLFLQLDTTYLRISVDQIFQVRTEVINAPGCADYDSNGTLTILLPKDFELISNDRTQNFKQYKEVVWHVRSPPSPSKRDSILIYISKKPNDQNNPAEHAQVTTDSVFLFVETLASLLEILNVSIIEPPGAMDGILSTEQRFVVQAKIIKQMVEDICAQITIPDNYFNSDESIKYLDTDEGVKWHLQAPSLPVHSQKKIIIQAWGTKENDTTKIFSRIDSSLFVTTLSKANLKVHAEIVDPLSAIQGQISPGLEFQIKGEILNLGEANIYGNSSLIINVQDRKSFSVLGDTILPTINNSVNWIIRASKSIDTQPKIIKIKIHNKSFDENTDTTAYIAEDNKIYDVQVFTVVGMRRLELMVKQLPDIAPKTIAPGITDILMGIEFTNLASESGYPIKINLLKFDVEDRNNNLISPTLVISGFRIRTDNSILGQTTPISENPVEVQFNLPISLDAQESERLYMEIDFTETLSQQFKINLRDSSYIDAESQFDLFIVNEFRNSSGVLNLRSHCPVVTQKNLKGSFGNYPNPFGSPGRQITHFIYYLPRDTDIELKIYTLIGELVWSRSYTRNQSQGRKGLHHKNEIIWNGNNLRGNKVLNGVYIARIQMSYGESAITKVAVIK